MPAADPARQISRESVRRSWRTAAHHRRDRVLGWAVVGNTYLWFLAALLQFVIVIYGHDVLRVNETQISYLQAAVGIGIGVGSLAAGYLSRGKIEYRLVPAGRDRNDGIRISGLAARASASGRCASILACSDFSAASTRSRSTRSSSIGPSGKRKAASSPPRTCSLSSACFLPRDFILCFLRLPTSTRQIFLAGAVMTLAATFYAIF